jgi:hypothetical protein
VETEDEWNARIERVAKSVFFGVFKRNFPEELMQETNLLLLDQNFVRTECNLLYTMRDAVFKRGADEIKFILFESRSEKFLSRMNRM